MVILILALKVLLTTTVPHGYMNYSWLLPGLRGRPVQLLRIMLDQKLNLQEQAINGSTVKIVAI